MEEAELPEGIELEDQDPDWITAALAVAGLERMGRLCFCPNCSDDGARDRLEFITALYDAVKVELYGEVALAA